MLLLAPFGRSAAITTNNGLNSFNDQSVRFAEVFWHYTLSNCNNDTSACLLWPSPAAMAGVTAHKKSPLISQIVTVPILPEVLQKRNSTFMSPLLPPKGVHLYFHYIYANIRKR